MTLKIGVVSPNPHTRSLHLTNASSGSSIYWFNEMEAAFAFLLTDMLNELYIDRSLIKRDGVLIDKYRKMIEQLHPDLKIEITSLEPGQLIKNAPAILHFPRLEVMFKNGELESFFQPIVFVDEAGMVIHGIECLSRFHYDGHRYAPELVFNYAAEKLKLTSYDRICLMQSLRLIPDVGETAIFINVRPQTLVCDSFLPWFKDLLKKSSLSPEQIIIEITEQYCNISESQLQKQCQALNGSGFKLAIDDFGSGVSNLSMLEIMRPSYMKISGRFIKNCHRDITKQKIIKNVLDLTNDLGIYAVVENVELAEEWQKVHELGASFAQGYYFYKPMPADELADLLTASALSPSSSPV